MSRFFPHPPYAEDQPLSKTILTVHVLTRAVTTGTMIGAGLFGVQDVSRRLRKTAAPLAVPRAQAFLQVAGRSTVWTTGIVGVGLVFRMWGREGIEWQDRSWRLLENKGQLETDDWTYAGMAAGLAASTRLRPFGWAGAVGAVGTGSVVGMLGYMGWRYGVHRGKFPGDEGASE